MALEMQGRSSDGCAMDWLWLSMYHGLAMLWATFWALVLGFTISGVLQVFVSKERMSRAFGQTNLKSVSLATGLGAASSSCSYAAVAAARSAIQQGAALLPALAFMFASTDLVIELGAVLWVLMGWQFVLAEILGAFMLIIIIYAKYYGARAAAWITGIFYVSMVLAGIIVDLIFNALGLIPQGPRPPSAVEHAHIIWNYTSMLDVAAAIFTAWLLFLYFKSRDRDSARACH